MRCAQNDAFEVLETTRQGEWVSVTAEGSG